MNTPEQPFDEPWQAQLFALTVALNEAGWLDWSDWSTAFGQARAAKGDYFEDWLATLQTILAERDVAGGEQIAALAASWQRAARATPHGQPIELSNDPEALDDG
ncbi:nitrile hydratase accessory protein [Paracoccus tegillarcae]|uniref:nitrile hydratase accessory protein n=1 Tax=Paracoccus tegillarcae TaxID=1529068 RepID=UPI001E64B699|nr:nitrile hydratase accessory protein [Paracoccus tegillarcae]